MLLLACGVNKVCVLAVAGRHDAVPELAQGHSCHRSQCAPQAGAPIAGVNFRARNETPFFDA